MRGVFSANYINASTSDTGVYFTLKTPASGLIEILSASMSNYSDSSVGLLVSLKISNGVNIATTPVTVVPVSFETTGYTSSVLASGYTGASSELVQSAIVYREGFNSAGSFRYEPTPEERIIVGPNKVVAVVIESAPSAVLKTATQIIFREIGLP